jgi:eukaryotic-like serine/threonine-protein kinase
MTSIELASVEEHLDECPSCRKHLALLVRARTGSSTPAPRDPARPLLEPGAQLGRYRIVRVLGVGAMGVVYAAHDAELEREVALKTLRAGSGERLLEEAQALARLRHPNVVAVHDVGREGERVFVAMELVQGVTLGEWLAERRTVDQITEVFAQAARGLAAAHAAGLVHRDFKPDNVLVGNDGRVCVTDFGMARALEGTESSCPVAAPPPNDDAGPPDDTAPHTGQLDNWTPSPRVLAGTPAYMAPEQHRGLPADARSDQFAFCVALYEALYGERPFAGETLADLAAQAARGVARLPSRGRQAMREPASEAQTVSYRVPTRLARVVARGLTPAPQARFPSMDALLAALAGGSRAGLSAAVALGASALVALAAVAWMRAHAQRPAVCLDNAHKLAAVWDDARRQSVRAAFDKIGGADTAAIVMPELDRYAARWTAIEAESCAAAQAQPGRPERALQVRCLGRRLREVDTLARVFGEADRTVLRRAGEAVYGLSSVEDCADTAQLGAHAPPVSDPATRARLAEIEDQVAEARALENAGRYEAGLARATPALDAAQKLGDRSLTAEAQLALGRLTLRTADYDASERHLSDAVLSAEAGKRDDLRAAALARQVMLVGVRLRRLKEGAELARRAGAVVERLAGEPRLKTELLYAEGLLAGSQGDYKAAEARYRQALGMVQNGGGDPSMAGSLADGLGMALYDLGKNEEALEQLRAGLAARERLFGPRHLTVSFSLNNVCHALLALERPAEALPLVKRALAIAEAAVGTDHPDVAASLQILGDVELTLADYAPAEEHLQRALAIMEKTFGADSPNLTNALSGLARVGVRRHRFADAQRAYERMLANKQKSLGPDHPELATTLDSLAWVHGAKGEHKKELVLAERALALRSKDGDASGLVQSLINIGHASGKLGRTARAVSSLERAEKLLAPTPASPDLAEARFDLAEVLWTSGARNRALALAGQAERGFGDPGHVRELGLVRRWLEERR